MTRRIEIETQRFKIAGGGFAISRGRRTHAEVLTIRITDGQHSGIGECVPYARYGESLESVAGQIREIEAKLASGLDRQGLQPAIAAGAARNAVDCALWDLDAKLAGSTVAALSGTGDLSPLTTAYTISVGTPEDMAAATLKAAHRPLLKIKLAGPGDVERIAAVRKAAPNSTLIVDANEAWDESCFHSNLEACDRAGVALIEQPLPAGKDDALEGLSSTAAICADESLHTSADLEKLRARYDAVNIKLDKAGGLTEALVMARRARELDFKVMVGCMLGTSLAMAPAVYVAQPADFVDLDGPLLLEEDRTPALRFEGSTLYPPPRDLWG
ncbi:N-acetyl-D-Glu racemase DgcA [Roseibium sediminis]|uniref:N-acetyl-D-Glu racemase DgcA n=1 Tax=Roseibium sediminis TaxID=1775174 RepID=UPI00123CF147|nr:N-acetyl-D-Glu racemase DgcA [Roseibium sediminis]